MQISFSIAWYKKFTWVKKTYWADGIQRWVTFFPRTRYFLPFLPLFDRVARLNQDISNIFYTCQGVFCTSRDQQKIRPRNSNPNAVIWSVEPGRQVLNKFLAPVQDSMSNTGGRTSKYVWNRYFGHTDADKDGGGGGIITPVCRQRGRGITDHGPFRETEFYTQHNTKCVALNFNTNRFCKEFFTLKVTEKFYPVLKIFE